MVEVGIRHLVARLPVGSDNGTAEMVGKRDSQDVIVREGKRRGDGRARWKVDGAEQRPRGRPGQRGRSEQQ